VKSIYLIFKIPNVSLYTGDDADDEEIRNQVLQSLKNRTATFEKMFEIEDGDVTNEFDDYDSHSNVLETRFEIGISVNDELQLRFEEEPDLVYTLAAHQLERGYFLARNWKRDDVTFLGFEGWGK